MAFDAVFESAYIRQFSATVRSGATSRVYTDGVERITKALLEIPIQAKREEALDRLGNIGNYGFLHIEDPEGSRAEIADKIDELADFIEQFSV